jgi:LPXTG-site transpeptidase (sortase) family protein
MTSQPKKLPIKTIVSVITGIAVALLLVQYFPLIKAEITYIFRKSENKTAAVTLGEATNTSDQKTIRAADNDFSLVIPKIGVNIKVIPDVDPNNDQEYQQALSKGVAHAKGTSTPQDHKNTVLFAHSTDNFYNATRYNAIFYLLNKLEIGEKAYVVYDSRVYEYSVVKKQIVEKDAISYMEQQEKGRLTLITCWPPGTTLKRLVVVAELDR